MYESPTREVVEMDQKEWFCHHIKELEKGMYSVSYSILKNDADVQDAIQETIYRAYKNLHTLKNHKKFKAWLYKILTNVSLEILSKKQQVFEYDDERDLVEVHDIDIETKMTLWEWVNTLNQPYRTVIILFYYEDMSLKEISQITNTSFVAVKKQLSRGRAYLKEKLKEAGDIL